jgi:ATP-dependent helicase/nuclease subunit A
MPERPFTDEQREAIARRSGPLLLSAAAGSGKTSVLVERFVRMVVEDGIEPGKILAITFTEKAAGELRSRIREQLLERGERTRAQEAEAAAIGTFHGFCARVLRSHAVAAGMDPGFSVLDEATARALREAAFETAAAGFLGDPGDPPRPDALDLVAAYGMDRLQTAVLAVHGQLRSAGQVRPQLPAPAAGPDPLALRAGLQEARDGAIACLDGIELASVENARTALGRCDALLGEGLPTLAQLEAAAFKPGNTGALKSDPCRHYLEALEAFAAACREAAGAEALALFDELLGRYADAYADAKRERSAVDFDDLELLVARLFDRQPGLAASWAERFDRVMVDEFQDTNRLQVALLSRLDRGQTFRVGDELQSIYRFRHASVEVFREAREELAKAGAVASLRTNFRTRPEILAAINAASAVLHECFEPLVPGREDPPAQEPLVELLLTDDQADWSEQEPLPGGPQWRWAEARLLAQRIAELVAAGTPAGDIVVLVRAATDIACFERAIEEHGISTLSSGGRGFWARQQVQDLTQYLAALANPRDELALFSVLASPLGPALSSDGLARLAVTARRAGTGIWRVIEESEEPELVPWRQEFVAERSRAARLSLADLLTRVVARSGYDGHVLRLPGGLRRLANVRKLIRLAAQYEADHGRGVRGFIDRANAELEAEAREGDAPVELAGLDAVRLMTIHAAKGLEFPVVAVADLGRDPNTQLPDVLVDGNRVGLRLVTLGGKGHTADYLAIKEDRQRAEREETLRVFHVAMTRAKERLILSGAANVEKWPDSEKPIAWLLPAFRDHAGLTPVLNRPDNGVLRPVPAAPPPRGPTSSPISVTTQPGRGVAAPVAVSTLSYSALSRYAQCGYRFYLERVLRLPEQDPPPHAGGGEGGLDALTRGSIAHDLLERLDLLDPQVPSPEEIAKAGERRETTLTDADLSDVAALIEGAVSSDMVRRVRDADERHVEESFALAVGDLPLFTGFIDVRAVEADGAHLIVDYKSDRLDGADPEPLVEQDYGVQRRLYALAALRAGAERVEVAHLFLERPDEPATATFTLDDIQPIEDYLEERAQGIMSSRFEVAAHPHLTLCATCPGRNGMCSWPEERVLVSLAES